MSNQIMSQSEVAKYLSGNRQGRQRPGMVTPPVEGTGQRVVFFAPIVLKSEANMREHWAAKSRRKKQQQAVVIAVTRTAPPCFAPCFPVNVSLCRVYSGRGKAMDKDNLAGSFKHVQDAVANWLGVDDGDSSKVDWQYSQEKGEATGVRITLTKGNS